VDDERTSDTTAGVGRLSFPDLPRLELDQLLEQLIDRAHEVMNTQERLRGLLRASQTVTGDLALPTVLRHIAEAAKDLVGARYAALGVIGTDGQLVEFVHTGMSEDTVARIGLLPEGKGLLGVLIEDSEPIRLARIADDPRSSGFPDEHPPMDSFLGVPIEVRGTAFGNLYLAESHNGRFSADDEELAKALAATAGSAIDNARLYQAAGARQKWLEASNTITRRLLSSDSGSPLTLIAEHTRDTAEADLVTVLRPTATDGELRIEAAVGVGADELLGTAVPITDTLSGQVFTNEEPVVGSWRRFHPNSAPVPDAADIDPVLVVPLIGSKQVHGVLTAARLAGRPQFTRDELDLVAAFANQASVSIELAETRVEQQRNELFEERDRIGAELRTRAIQRLSSTTMSLLATAAGTRDETTATRLRATIGELDDIVTEIRNSVYQLEGVGPQTRPLRHQLLDELTEAAAVLGFTPSLQLIGQTHDVPSGPRADMLIDVVRETLTVIGRAGTTRSIDITVSRTDRLGVEITHDGTVAGDASDAHLAVVTAMAERHGGTCRSTTPGPGLTRFTWSVPLPS